MAILSLGLDSDCTCIFTSEKLMISYILDFHTLLYACHTSKKIRSKYTIIFYQQFVKNTKVWQYTMMMRLWRKGPSKQCLWEYYISQPLWRIWHCFWLHCVLSKFICWCHNPRYLRMWLYLYKEIRFKLVIKLKWGH